MKRSPPFVQTHARGRRLPAVADPPASPPNVSPLSLDPEVLGRASLWNEPAPPPTTTQPVEVPPPVPLDLTPNEAAWLAHYNDAVTLAVAQHNAISSQPSTAISPEASAPEAMATQPAAAAQPAAELEVRPAAELEVRPAAEPEARPAAEPEVQTALESDVQRLDPPAWEVPAFDIPDVVDQLFGDETRRQLARRLAAASAAGLRSLAITSVSRGEGRTTVAIGLALAAASANLDVVLVDADTDGPSLASRLRVEVDRGWNEVGDGPLAEAAVASLADRITLLPMRPQHETLLRPSDLSSAINECKTVADLIIVDLPASATAMAAVCDTTALVRDASNQDDAAIETMTLTLRRGGQQGIGVIENFCPPVTSAASG